MSSTEVDEGWWIGTRRVGSDPGSAWGHLYDGLVGGQAGGAKEPCHFLTWVSEEKC